MHNENYIFSIHSIIINNITYISYDKIITPINNVFINIPGGLFLQGSLINKNRISFDNEMPIFTKEIKSFWVSKYPITEYEYLEFVNAGGYTNKKYWDINAQLWLKSHNINAPMYWFKKNSIWYRRQYDIIVKIGSNLPVCNISWYEAKAYCLWKKCRLITESEWEYIATNLGKTEYPWGNDSPNHILCNLNYKNDYCVDVNLYSNSDSKLGISQLIGNVWEWCAEDFYPYDYFLIDPIYREMSYPLFGQKKICRGGCFCVDDYLINSKYRNAQSPDCRIQFIGFRICKDYLQTSS
jgi:iron(II)-dependent oxidoreductase